MNPDESARWKNEALDVVFAALASSQTLAGRVVFKGARVLSRRLRQVHRQSLDIDMNLSAAFVSQFPAREDQRRALETDIDTTLRRYMEAQPIVRYEIRAFSVKPKSQGDHPRGWNAFEARIGLMDRSNPNASALPTLVLDISAPESLGPNAVAPLDVDGHSVLAYTLERSVGEKLRAFLSSLPAHRRKLARPGDAVRAKDIFDIACVERDCPTADSTQLLFWQAVGTEFRLACESRFVDCEGMQSFEDELLVTRSTYNSDSTIPSITIPFDAAWASVERIVRRLERDMVLPLLFPLG